MRSPKSASPARNWNSGSDWKPAGSCAARGFANDAMRAPTKQLPTWRCAPPRTRLTGASVVGADRDVAPGHQHPRPSVTPDRAAGCASARADGMRVHRHHRCVYRLSHRPSAGHSYCRTQRSSVLLIGANVLSRRINPADPATVAVFGDGAGAIILSPAADSPDAILALHLDSRGEFYDQIVIPAGGSRTPVTPQAIEAGEHWMRMTRSSDLYREAVRAMARSGLAALEARRVCHLPGWTGGFRIRRIRGSCAMPASGWESVPIGRLRLWRRSGIHRRPRFRWLSRWRSPMAGFAKVSDYCSRRSAPA